MFDKNDVYAYEYPSLERKKYILTHTGSLILCMDTARDCLLTGDRDEKVRISEYPRASEIRGYCIGHDKFVARVHAVCAKDNSGSLSKIITCGGDGTVRIWGPDGREEVCHRIAEDGACAVAVDAIGERIAAFVETSAKTINMFSITEPSANPNVILCKQDISSIAYVKDVLVVLSKQGRMDAFRGVEYAVPSAALSKFFKVATDYLPVGERMVNVLEDDTGALERASYKRQRRD